MHGRKAGRVLCTCRVDRSPASVRRNHKIQITIGVALAHVCTDWTDRPVRRRRTMIHAQSGRESVSYGVRLACEGRGIVRRTTAG